MKKLNLLLTGFVILILILAIRGIPGNPTAEQLNLSSWTDSGPFELSPERGRFALAYSLVKDKSLFFSLPVARFATPDLGYINGRYVSLFAPAVSFLIIPGFIVGQFLGFSQVGSFAVIALFALINVILIKCIANRLGAHPVAAWLGALVFIFATPAFAYAVNLYQHHISSFLILLSIYIMLRWNNIWSLSLIWFLYAASIPVDYPNLVLMLPLALFALGRLIIFGKDSKRLTFSVNLVGLLTTITAIVPLMFLLWFNANSYGNPWQFSGTVPDVAEIDDLGNPTAPKTAEVRHLEKFTNPASQQKSVQGFFRTRNMLNGFYIHFISPDRGILYFTPVVFLSIFGAVLALKRRAKLIMAMTAVVIVNILLYSMWGDPWGGWAFGSRYLIPSYAILSIFTALALTYFSGVSEKTRFRVLPLTVFFILFTYSAAVNTLGAITSGANPPQAGVLQLEKITGKVEKYTFARNWDFLEDKGSQAFIYQVLAFRYFTALQYYQILLFLIILCGLSLTVYLGLKGKDFS